MLTFFRKHLRGKFANALLAMIALSFSLWGVQNYFLGQKDSSVAKINGNPVSERQFKQTYWLLKQQIISKLGREVMQKSDFEKTVKKQAMAKLIQTELLRQDALNMGLAVSWQSAKDHVIKEKLFEDNGQFSEDRYREFLRAFNVSDAEFIRLARDEMLKNQVYTAFQAAFALPNEVLRAEHLFRQKRDATILRVPLQWYTQPEKFTVQQLKDYYLAHQNEFLDPERVKLDYLVLDPKQLIKEITVSDAELKKRYADEHFSESFKQMKKRLSSEILTQKLQETFTAKQEQLSELTYTDPESLSRAAQALHLTIHHSDWVTRDSAKDLLLKNNKVLEQAFSDEVLKEGNNSFPINLHDGELLVLRVVDHQGAAVKPFNSVSHQIRKNITRKAKQRQTKDFTKQLVKDVQGGRSPEHLAKLHHLQISHLKGILRDNKTLDQALLVQLFGFPSREKHTAASFIDSTGGINVIHLEAVHYPSPKKEGKDHDVVKILEREDSELSYDLYTKSLLDSAKIKMHMKIF